MTTLMTVAQHPKLLGLSGCTCRYRYQPIPVGRAWVRVQTGAGCPFHHDMKGRT